MTPTGRCPDCGTGHLTPTPDAPGYTRCPTCCTTWDHHGNAYDVQMRLKSPREGT